LTLKWDVRNFADPDREAFAERIRVAEDWKLPHLDSWNTSLCRQHRIGWVEEYFENGEDKKRVITDRPKPGCRNCAIIFRKHQRISVAWLYFKKHALLADTMGSGKTSSAGGLLAMMKQTGELSDPDTLTDGRPGKGRALIIPRSPALRQWQSELNRMMPTLNVQVATGSRAQREQVYAQRWDALLIGPQMLAGSSANPGDYRTLLEIYGGFSAVITDDIDLLRHMDTNAYQAIEKCAFLSDRVVIMTGTPLQKKLDELYAQLHPLGGERLFGDIDTFRSNHIRTERIAERHPKSGLIVGFKNQTQYYNMDILKKKIRPLYMRRTAADLDDVDLPTINSNDVFLELYPEQRKAYRELQRGVVELMKDGELKQKQVHARAQLTYGAQICTGLAALGQEDLPNTSVKMDWVMENIRPGGDLGTEKVVIFAQYKNTIRALRARLEGHDIGYVTIWGEDNNQQRRADAVERFWEDPNCRVLIGTQAIEQSLNLQVARHLINLDMIMNPARMEQLAGRIRRDGSAFKHVYVHNLLTIDTQEERYLPLLEREAALAGYVWDESSELFNALSPMQMLQLITG
jgi:SNF2 family DNA or RNA helicase